MKLENLIITIVLILLAAFAVIGALNTRLSERDAFIQEQERYIEETTARIRELSQKEEKGYTSPLKQYYVSSIAGYRVNPMGGGDERLHKGVDLVEMPGAEVRAVLPGRVMEHYLTPGWHGGKEYFGHPVYGCMIVLRHRDFFTIYGHLSESYVHEGDWIEEGQVIGRVGNTGMSTGEHLHFEIIVNPFRFLENQ